MRWQFIYVQYSHTSADEEKKSKNVRYIGFEPMTAWKSLVSGLDEAARRLFKQL